MDKLKGYRTTPLERFVARLKCHSCGAKPGWVAVADHAIMGSENTIGDVATWSVEVTPERA